MKFKKKTAVQKKGKDSGEAFSLDEKGFIVTDNFLNFQNMYRINSFISVGDSEKINGFTQTVVESLLFDNSELNENELSITIERTESDSKKNDTNIKKILNLKKSDVLKVTLEPTSSENDGNSEDEDDTEVEKTGDFPLSIELFLPITKIEEISNDNSPKPPETTTRKSSDQKNIYNKKRKN